MVTSLPLTSRDCEFDSRYSHSSNPLISEYMLHTIHQKTSNLNKTASHITKKINQKSSENPEKLDKRNIV